MTTLSARVDHFVRWFVDSSPDPQPRVPRPPSGLDQPVVRKSALAVAALVALMLLLLFHSVVVGAVERAAQRRAEADVAALHTMSRHVAQSSHFATRKMAAVGTTD